MTYNCYYHTDPVDYWMPSHCHRSIVNHLIAKYPEHTFNVIDTQPTGKLNWEKFGYHGLIIENDNTGKYFVFTYWDSMQSFTKENGWDLDNLVEIFTGSGAFTDLVKYRELINPKIVPFTYPIANKHIERAIEENKSISKHVPAKPTFRGKTYNFREYLKNDNRFKVNTDIIDYEGYVDEISRDAIGFSPNGNGEICMRCMEIMAVKSCLFRAKLTTKFHDPLIPDYHYISYDCDSIDHIQNHEEYYQARADIIYNKWLEVKDNVDLINHVTANGHAWYKRNVPPVQHGRLATELVKLYKLD